MKKLLASLLLSLFLTGAAAAGSSINPNAPGQGSGLTSLTVRNNFAAAYQDINNILGVFAGTTAPTTPSNLQSWADYTASPIVVFRYWNATTGTWVPYSTLNINTGVVTPYNSSSGFVAVAPIVVSVSGGVATFTLNKDSNFSIVSNNLALASANAGWLLANCTAGSAEPVSCPWTSFADQAIGNVNGMIPSRVGGAWGTVSTGVSGHAIPFLDAAALTWSGVQTIYPGAGVPAAVQAGALMRIVALDGQTARYQLDSFNANGSVTCVRANGTLASPSAPSLNDLICQMSGVGYDGANYTGGNKVGIRMYAAQNWSVGANGTRVALSVTQNGTTTFTDQFAVENDGGVTIPPTVTGGSKGPGTVNVGGALYNNGVLITGTGTVTAVDQQASLGIILSGTCTYSSSGTCTFQIDKATLANYYAATANKVLTADIVYPPEVAVTYGTTTTFDFSTFLNAQITLTGNITTQTLSNVTVGKAGSIRFTQDGTGSRTTVWNTIFKFPGGVLPTLTLTAGANDLLSYNCVTATFCQASLAKDVRNP